MSKIEECYNKECGYCIDNKYNFNINDITKCNWYLPQPNQTKNNARKIEECWVIQRDDGKYVNFMDNEDLTWYEHIWQATMTWDKWQAEKDIILWKLQNCRPVKVEIRVVGE